MRLSKRFGIPAGAQASLRHAWRSTLVRKEVRKLALILSIAGFRSPLRWLPLAVLCLLGGLCLLSSNDILTGLGQALIGLAMIVAIVVVVLADRRALRPFGPETSVIIDYVLNNRQFNITTKAGTSTIKAEHVREVHRMGGFLVLLTNAGAMFPLRVLDLPMDYSDLLELLAVK
jgi:hypothetical protein